MGTNAFENIRVVTLKRASNKMNDAVLEAALPDVPLNSIRAICAELVARGLMHDEGIGRWDTAALEYLALTDFGQDFLEWVEGPVVDAASKGAER
ncbi:MAG: hypothetical protein QOD26_3825 [Betaproteobacteria bacterium]|jgi:hypothetical protein|nr:hypothetical protein [Betaproteobacteria bacterium]